MKSILKKTQLLALAVLTAGAVTLTPPKANAAIILGAHFGASNVGGAIIQLGLCLVLLPLCVLGEEGDVKPADSRSLAENGYTSREAADILRDQAQVGQVLMKKNARLEMLQGETPTMIAAQIRSLHPSVSPAYLQFVMDQAGSR